MIFTEPRSDIHDIARVTVALVSERGSQSLRQVFRHLPNYFRPTRGDLRRSLTRLGDLMWYTAVRLRAERRAGELLREMPKNQGTVAGNSGRKGRPLLDDKPKLADLKITKDESSRWQKLAAMPEAKFEEKVAGVKSVMRDKTEGSKPKPRSQRSPKAIEREEKIAALKDVGLTAPEIAAKVGLCVRAVHQALEHVEIKREAIPDIDPATLSFTAQEKFDTAIRQHKRKLDADFFKSVTDEVRKRIDEIVLPSWKKQIAEAQAIYNRRKGIMDKETFNMIRRGLHPDSRKSISDKKLEEAFDAFMRLEKFLLDEKNSPTELGDVPNSLADWDKMRKRPTKQAANPVARHRNGL